MIVTGAPIETMAYEEVEYWPEIKEIFDWAVPMLLQHSISAGGAPGWSLSFLWCS